MSRTREYLQDMLRHTDAILLVLCLAASGFGVAMVYSATRYMETNRLAIVQGAATLIGVVLFLLVQLVDLNELMKKKVRLWIWLTIVNFGLIALLKTPLGIADDTGNRAWLDFKFLPVNVQPAEIIKVLFVMVLAYQLSWLKENYTLKKIPHVAFLVCHFAPLFLLYYLISSDMGSALVMLFIFAAMCFVAGVALRWFILGGVVGGLAFYILWNENLIPNYMKQRFIVIFDHSYDPMGAGWHQTRSLMTLGGGKFTGMGFGQGTQTQSSYSGSLPARHTDFIFSVVGEELGMVGCVLVLILLTAIIWRCIIVSRNARTRMDAYICIGMVAMLMFQIIANVGMCLFIMPVIGLTLPFFSYGGSSIVMLFMAMGLVSGVHGRSAPDWLKGV